MLKVARPEPFSGAIPRTVLPSRNVTAPIGTSDWPAVTTLAVKVTLCPVVAGFAFDASIVTVAIPAEV